MNNHLKCFMFHISNEKLISSSKLNQASPQGPHFLPIDLPMAVSLFERTLS